MMIFRTTFSLFQQTLYTNQDLGSLLFSPGLLPKVYIKIASWSDLDWRTILVVRKGNFPIISSDMRNMSILSLTKSEPSLLLVYVNHPLFVLTSTSTSSSKKLQNSSIELLGFLQPPSFSALLSIALNSSATTQPLLIVLFTLLSMSHD